MTFADVATRLAGGAERVVPEDGLEEKLALGRPLRVKLGIDPTRPDLHIGFAVPLRKLRQFQDAGHVAVLIIGDFTARVGDPSGRSEIRPSLAVDEIEANARTYLEQAGKVIDTGSAEIRRNSEWLEGLGMEDILRLTASTTVAHMLERDDFRERYQSGKPISVVEFVYPLLQAQDSVATGADVELGGTDQTFNLLMGRELQRDRGQDPQVVMTLPLLEGIDGVRKMSKSYDNYIGLTDPPEEMFGRVMRIPDSLIVKYFRLATELPPEVVDEIESGLADGILHPGEQKRRLAREIVDTYHGRGAGREAEAGFDRVFKEHELPDEVDARPVSADVFGTGGLYVPALLVELGLVSSRSEGRRAIEQGSVRRDNQRVSDQELPIGPEELEGTVWSVGRRRHARVAGRAEAGSNAGSGG
jgi:tyrosyl-tRNA synthetase